MTTQPLPPFREHLPTDILRKYGAVKGMLIEHCGAWHLSALNPGDNVGSDCEFRYCAPIGTIAALTTPLPEPECDCGTETAKCTLCSKVESSGFYTGCMVKDGEDRNSGWECDGNGNLNRPHSPSCSIYRRWLRKLPHELAALDVKPEGLICRHKPTEGYHSVWRELRANEWPIPEVFPHGLKSADFAYAVPAPTGTGEGQWDKNVSMGDLQIGPECFRGEDFPTQTLKGGEPCAPKIRNAPVAGLKSGSTVESTTKVAPCASNATEGPSDPLPQVATGAQGELLTFQAASDLDCNDEDVRRMGYTIPDKEGWRKPIAPTQPEGPSDGEMLGCPFCGKAASDQLGELPAFGLFFVWCKNCGAHGPEVCKENAVITWNLRAAVAAAMKGEGK